MLLDSMLLTTYFTLIFYFSTGNFILTHYSQSIILHQLRQKHQGRKKTKRKKDMLYYLTPLLKGTVFFSFNNRPIPFRVLPSKQYRTVYSSCMVLNRAWEAKQNSQCIMSWEAFPVRICSLHSTWGFRIDPLPEQLRPTLQQENGTPVCERFQLQNSVFVLRNILHCELYLLYLPVQENSESMKAY